MAFDNLTGGALISMSSAGEQERQMQITHVSKNMNQCSFEKRGQIYSMTQRRNADVAQLDYLHFVTNMAVNIETFINMIDMATFIIEIGGQEIWKLRIDMLCYLEPCKQRNNNIYVKIPDYIVRDIKLVCLQFHNIVYKIENITDEIFNDIKLISSNTFLSNDDRQNITQTRQTTLIQQIESVYVVQNTRVSSIEKRLNFSNVTKGYFIQGNIDKLTEFSLYLNNNCRLMLNEDMINLYCFKISDKLLYISLDNTNNIKDMRPESFIGGFNQSRIDNINIKLTYSEPQDRCALHSLTCNTSIIHNGMFSLMMASSSHIRYETGNDPVSLPPPTRIHNSTNTIEWKYENIPINNERNTMCPISHEELIPNCKYCCCHQCKTKFDEQRLKTWLNSRKTCPICRVVWNNYTVFTNNTDDNRVIV